MESSTDCGIAVAPPPAPASSPSLATRTGAFARTDPIWAVPAESVVVWFEPPEPAAEPFSPSLATRTGAFTATDPT